MPPGPSDFVPPFISPLTHDQHAQLGRIAIVWGQIDMILDQLLQFAIGLTGQQRITIIGEKPIGAKLDMLSSHIDDIKDQNARQAAREFWGLANETKTMRNRCFHGVWGFRCGKKKDDIFAAAMHFKAKENPVRVDQLPALEKKLCKTARIGWKAVAKLSEFTADDRCGRLYHGPTVEGPRWLQEWRERHPVDDHSLDHRHKAGQLPFLTKPLWLEEERRPVQNLLAPYRCSLKYIIARIWACTSAKMQSSVAAVSIPIKILPRDEQVGALRERQLRCLSCLPNSQRLAGRNLPSLASWLNPRPHERTETLVG